MAQTWIRNKRTGQWRSIESQPGGIAVMSEDEEIAYDPCAHPVTGAPIETTSTVYGHGTWETKDSGAREVMETGSQRDSRDGKGRFELISPFALARIAGVYERGAKKYDDRNWEKGQKFSRFLDSALRHMNRFAMGWTDEDHVSQAAWNLLAILHFQELGRTDLDDLPHYQEGPKP
jgi:hypothetical protein